MIGSLRSFSTISILSVAATMKPGAAGPFDRRPQPGYEGLRPGQGGTSDRMDGALEIVDVDDSAIGSRPAKVLPAETAHALHRKAVAAGQGDGPGVIIDADAALLERAMGEDRPRDRRGTHRAAI